MYQNIYTKYIYIYIYKTVGTARPRAWAGRPGRAGQPATADYFVYLLYILCVYFGKSYILYILCRYFACIFFIFCRPDLVLILAGNSHLEFIMASTKASVRWSNIPNIYQQYTYTENIQNISIYVYIYIYISKYIQDIQDVHYI